MRVARTLAQADPVGYGTVRRPPSAPGVRRALEALACLLVLAGTTWTCSAPPSRSEPLWQAPRDATPIAAAVRFTGTQIVVENRGRELWRDVQIAVGRSDRPPAFRYRADAVLGGREIAVGALNFERPDGTRLSPFQLQPDRWSVHVRLPSAADGFAEGRFE